MASTIITPATCSSCKGAGTVIETRSRWIGSTKGGYASAWTGEVRCEACAGTGTDPFTLFVEDRDEADCAAEAEYLAHLDRLAELETLAEATGGEAA